MLVYAQALDTSPPDQTQESQPCRSAPLKGRYDSGRPEISIASLSFSGYLQMPVSEQEEIAASITQRSDAGSLDQVREEAEEKLRIQWLNHGYFKAQVSSDAHVLSSNSAGERIALSVHVDEGPQYRLAQITFKNNKAVSNEKVLRALFPLKDGDIFSREAIAKGLEHLRKAYGQLGYINFTLVPQTIFNDGNQTVSLAVDVDEGKQFYVSSIDVIGADPKVLKDLALKPGQIYNARLIEAFLQKHLPGAEVNDPHVVEKSLDEHTGTVALTFNFKACTE